MSFKKNTPIKTKKKTNIYSGTANKNSQKPFGEKRGRSVKSAFVKNKPGQKQPADQAVSQDISPDILTGRNAVREALKNDRPINKLLIAENAHGGSMQEIIYMARQKKVIIQTVSQNKLDSLSGTNHNQGILAYTPPVDYADLDDILQSIEQKDEMPFLIILDELEDPHNLGAILRTADAVGAHGVVIPKRRSCPLSSTVAKTSAGAIEYVPVARVNNIVQTLNKLKKNGFWITGADMSSDTLYYDADLKGPLALVIGSEGSGISQLVRQSCDFLVKIPMYGQVNSLNASNAAAVLMYEVLKQRTR